MKMKSIRLFRDDNLYCDDVFVAVNGKSYLIQRGVEVKLPYYVAEILESSQLQEQEAKRAVQDIRDRYFKGLSR